MAGLELSQFQLPGGYGDIYNFATQGGVTDWVSIGTGLILSTIIGGLVLVAILAIAGREWHEGIHPLRAFFVVLIINVINFFGILNIFSGGGYLLLILPLVIWIILLKVFFMGMAMKHVLILAVISYIVTLVVVPPLVGMFSGFLRF